MMRMLLLAASMLLVTIGIVTIYAVGHPVQEYKDTGTQTHTAYWWNFMASLIFGNTPATSLPSGYEQTRNTVVDVL